MANALQLIEIEKIQRTGYLDLGNCGLTELPEELFELVWLESLS
jgi:internalin A